MRTTLAAVGQTVLVVLFGLMLGAVVAALPFFVSVPRAMRTDEFMRVWIVLAPVITLAIIWGRLRRPRRARRRRPVGPTLNLTDE